MAESSAAAFGHYLRALRERRGLSLRRVAELTENSPEPFDKGTLSRLERGLQVPSIFKLGPLTRLYGVSAQALIERMELDREVDRLGRPATQGKDFRELQQLGRDALVRESRKWDAYAYFRDAVPLAGKSDEVMAWSNLATAIRSLGRNALALHELQEIDAAVLEPSLRALTHEKISNCYRCLREMARAEQYADSAAALAQEAGDHRTLAYAYTARANVAIDQEQWEAAAACLKKSLDAHHESLNQASLVVSSPAFEAQTLLMLADCSIHLEAVPRARRLALAAKRISEEHDFPLGLAYSEFLLGRIDEREGATAQAIQRWRKAAALATRLENQRLAFTIELELFRQALRVGDSARARAARSRLDRLAPWVPAHIPALREFKELTDRPATTSEGTALQGGLHDQAPDRDRAHSPARTRSRGRGRPAEPELQPDGRPRMESDGH